MTMRPSSTRRRIVPSERTEVAALTAPRNLSRDAVAGRRGGARPRRGGDDRVAVRAAPAGALLRWSARTVLDPAVAVVIGGRLRLGLDRPPDDVQQRRQ